MSSFNPLEAVSPIDGRYRKVIEPLKEYFSEYALFRYRCLTEIEYFISLCDIPLPQLSSFPKKLYGDLRKIYQDFNVEEALKIKEIENTTNHDIKAVEYYIKNKFDALNLSKYKEFVHFGLTSYDINNTAIPLLLKEGFENEILPGIKKILTLLKSKAEEWKSITMLARTHGQPASPTRLGKEIEVFIFRIEAQLNLLSYIPYSAKFGGATGNFNAHYVAYPEINWNDFADDFVNNKLGLSRSYPTTQIEHYDNFGAFCHNLQRINTILLDFCRDIWTYIMLEFFTQKIKKGEIGSSSMPHKVNPIDFENAEGNIGIANSVFAHFAEKLPVSRLQRDLSDSTVLRNIGVPLSHSLIAYKSILRGIEKLQVNKNAIEKDLNNHWEVVAEAIQTILRREEYPEPYEALKKLTRGNKTINKDVLIRFIDSLDISESVKNELKQITPFNYT